MKLPLYATPAVAAGGAVGEMLSGDGAITIVNLAVAAAPRLSVTRAVNCTVPALPGVPLIAPVELFSDRPAGRAPCEMSQV